MLWPQREPPILHVRSCFISKTRSWWVERHCPTTTELISPYTLTIQVTPKVLPYSNNSICVITVVQAYLISLLQNIVILTQIPEGRDTTTFMDCWAWITAWRCNFWPKWRVWKMYRQIQCKCHCSHRVEKMRNIDLKYGLCLNRVDKLCRTWILDRKSLSFLISCMFVSVWIIAYL